MRIFILSILFILSLSSNSMAVPFDTLEQEKKNYNFSVYEAIEAIDKVLLYCNTKEFIKNMLDELYVMSIAAKGSVDDRAHRHIADVELWINPKKDQWAIIFNYTNTDKSCVLGGNDIELYTP